MARGVVSVRRRARANTMVTACWILGQIPKRRPILQEPSSHHSSFSWLFDFLRAVLSSRGFVGVLTDLGAVGATTFAGVRDSTAVGQDVLAPELACSTGGARELPSPAGRRTLRPPCRAARSGDCRPCSGLSIHWRNWSFFTSRGL
jgi:hypothetical protein